MGFFNMMSSIGRINKLLIEAEHEIVLIAQMRENQTPHNLILSEIRQLERIYNDVAVLIDNSSGARTAVYEFVGRKMRSWEILNTIKSAIIMYT